MGRPRCSALRLYLNLRLRYGRKGGSVAAAGRRVRAPLLSDRASGKLATPPHIPRCPQGISKAHTTCPGVKALEPEPAPPHA